VNVAAYMTKTPQTIGVEQSLAVARRLVVAGDESSKVLGVFAVVDALRALAAALRSPAATGA